MAELFVAGPAVIAVIQICDRIVGLCKYYIETVRDARSDLKAMLVEISFLKTTLETLDFFTSCSGNVSAQNQGSHKLKDPIEECLRLVQELEKLFPSDTHLSSNNTSKRQTVKATFEKLAWPLKESKARKLLELIRPLKETFILELTSQSRQDIKDIKTQTLKTQEVVTDTQRKEIYAWLQHTDPSSLFYKAQNDYEPNTGNWVFRTPEWPDWIDLKNRCLWIHGIPGAGKTVLISHLIKTIQQYCGRPEADGCVCVYYFCFYGHNQDEGKPFLRWLISQLCRRKQLFPSSVLSMYNNGGEPSLLDLLKALEEVLRDFKTAYVVIDALDESLPRDDMLEVVRQIVKDSRFGNLQLLASSRRYVEIQRTMEAISTPLSMDNYFVGEDIKTHVHSFLHSSQKYKRFPTILLAEIEDAVSEGAKGMFRWAVCQLDILHRLKCESDIIREHLQDLPKTLKETYDRVLLMLSEEERPVVNCFLEWITFYSGMHRHGIPCQILSQVAERCTSKPDGFQSGYFYDEETIKELGGCLIKVSPEEVWHPDKFRTVTVNFAHYTVREYIDSGGLSRDPVGQLAVPEKPLMQQPLKVVFEEVRRLDLNPAGLQKIGSISSNRLLEVMFADFNICCTISALFALRDWASEIAQHEHLFHLAVGIFDPSGECFGFLCTVAEELEYELDYFSSSEMSGRFWDVVLKVGSPSAIQLLCLLDWLGCTKSSIPLIKRFVEMIGIEQLTQERLRFQTQTDVCGRSEISMMDGTIIEAAAQGFVTGIPESDFGRLLDLSGTSYDPSKVLFSFLARYIRVVNADDYWKKGDIIQQLLQRGADPNARNHRVTLLQIAAYQGDYNGVRMLLEAKADPNQAGNSIESPWEEELYLSRYNKLFGASPLYICNNFHLNFASRNEKANAERKQDIEAMLVQYGANRSYDQKALPS